MVDQQRLNVCLNRSGKLPLKYGLFPAELDAWKRDAIAGLGEPRAASAVEARQDRRRVKELERELHRKDKALAETAALLVLSKKLAAVFHQGEDA